MANTPDFIPDTDADLSTFSNSFMAYYSTNLVALGGVAGDVTALAPLVSGWPAAINDAALATQALHEKLGLKATARKNLVDKLRSLARQVQARPATTDAQRLALGLTVKDTVRTTSTAVPATRPALEVGTGEALRHTLNFRNEGAQNRAKPADTKGCEIWCKLGAAPVGVADQAGAGDMHFLGLDTATPYLASYGQEDGGKTAYYRARWVGTRGQLGPWSEVVEATMVG